MPLISVDILFLLFLLIRSLGKKQNACILSGIDDRICRTKSFLHPLELRTNKTSCRSFSALQFPPAHRTVMNSHRVRYAFHIAPDVQNVVIVFLLDVYVVIRPLESWTADGAVVAAHPPDVTEFTHYFSSTYSDFAHFSKFRGQERSE